MSLIGTATLTGIYSKPPVVAGIIVGPFLVHSFEDGGWAITHRNSGLGFAYKRFCCALKAILVAETAATILDWDRTPEEMRQDTHWKDVLPAVQTIICPAGCKE
jgi:hypothetical protein